MGCFNSSGFISKLPIRYGDRVVCFIATENPCASIRSLYIPDCRLVPWGIPVRGEYDDYGSITNIDRDYNTNFLCKLFNVEEPEEIFKAVERCLYGDSLDENIKYWKHNKDKMKMYQMLLPMYGNIKDYLSKMNKMTKSKRPTQPICTLMFEHEAVYDYITENDVDDSWHKTNFDFALDMHIKQIKLEETLSKLIAEYYDSESTEKSNIKTFFERRYNEYNPFDFIMRVIDKDINAQKQDIIEKIKKSYAEYLESLEKSNVSWSAEGRSPMFMYQLKLMSSETYPEFVQKKKAEIVRFCRMMRYMSYMPLIFECSITAGQQHYNANGFIELYDYLYKFSNKLFEDEPEDE